MNKLETHNDLDIFRVLAHLVKQTHAGEIKWEFTPRHDGCHYDGDSYTQHEKIRLDTTSGLHVSIEKQARYHGFLGMKTYYVYHVYMYRSVEMRCVPESEVSYYATEGTNFELCQELINLAEKAHNYNLIVKADSTLKQVLAL